LAKVAAAGGIKLGFNESVMPIGTCRLCLIPDIELRDSHFVPRAFYKLFRERGLHGMDPVMSSQERSMLSQRQAKDYLLCAICEDRFNRGGETWLLANSWRDPRSFRCATS
jgi:hypothetical protein